jgi:DNA-binding GntR family transcriptional regulator
MVDDHNIDPSRPIMNTTKRPQTSITLDKAHPEPIWRQVAASMRENITSRRWPEHHKLTAEEDLAEELEISRGTLRRALSALVDEGLLVQIQGRGTFVTAKSTDLPLAQRLVSLHELFALSGKDATTEVVSRESTLGRKEVREQLGVSDDEQLMWLRRRMLVEGEVFVLLDNYVRHTLCPGLDTVDFSAVPLFAAIEQAGLEIGWGRRTFAARTAHSMEASSSLLTADPDEPVLYLEQVTFLADDRPIEYSDVWIRGDKLRVTTVLHR